MLKDRQAALEKLKTSYGYYYELEEGSGESGLPLAFFGQFHARDEGYVLIKSAKIWFAESNEYIYLFSAPHMDGETVERCLDHVMEDVLPRIKPFKHHRDSYIIAVFLADVIDAEAQKIIRDRRFYKSFKFGLEGWSSLKTAGAELERELITTNRAGRDLKKFLKKLLRSEKV